MAHLVMLVLDNPDDLGSLLDAWEATGVKGVTILRSSGIGRVRRAALRDDVPLMPSLHDLLQVRRYNHRTVFSVVECQEQVDALIAAAQQVIGDFNQPHTGLMFVVPLTQAFGLKKEYLTQREGT